MNIRKFLLPVIFAALFSTSAAFAQKPDTTTLKVRNFRFPEAYLITKSGDQEHGYMAYHFPYSPDKEVYLIPKDGNLKNTATHKVKFIESITYADLRYVQILPDNDRIEYLAREAATGELNLYTFLELNKAPAIIPVAGAVRAFSIPFDHCLFFIENNTGIKKIDRSNFQKEILNYVGTNAALAEKIRNKTYKYRDTETIIKEYNASFLNK